MRRTLALIPLSLLLLAGCGAKEKTSDLTFSTEQLTAEPTFLSAKSGKSDVEFIAMKADDDSLRLSYNTCQSCNGSPQAYFVYDNGVMTCQNCGLTFEKDVVGTTAQGCNPILVEDYVIDKNQVTIPASVIDDAYHRYFQNWKTNVK